MPQFDLRGIHCAQYNNNNGVITYTDVQEVGDAMTATLEMRFAEGRLYAESTLAEYIRKATGGTIALGVKYIKNSAQQLMFGSSSNSRDVTVGQSVESISSLVIGAKNTPSYVGVSFYAPDMVDGVEKYTCVFVAKCLFGPPSMSLQTAGENIQFNTPVTSGEFLADDAFDQNMLEAAVCDSEEAAIAWCAEVFGDGE